MALSGPQSTSAAMSAIGGNVLQNSTRGSWLAIIELGTNDFLNQHCAFRPDLESILRAQALKIVLRHIRGYSGHVPRARKCCLMT